LCYGAEIWQGLNAFDAKIVFDKKLDKRMKIVSKAVLMYCARPLP